MITLREHLNNNFHKVLSCQYSYTQAYWVYGTVHSMLSLPYQQIITIKYILHGLCNSSTQSVLFNFQPLYKDWCAKLLRKYTVLSPNLIVNSANNDTEKNKCEGFSIRWMHPPSTYRVSSEFGNHSTGMSAYRRSNCLRK